MKDINNEVRIAQNVLKNSSIYADVYPYNDIAICVDISWGDWKHDHMRCDYLMKLHGYTYVGCEVTESDGSDCYSATHLYLCA